MGAGARLAEERDRWPDHWRVADLEQEEDQLLELLDPAEELRAVVPGRRTSADHEVEQVLIGVTDRRVLVIGRRRAADSTWSVGVADATTSVAGRERQDVLAYLGGRLELDLDANALTRLWDQVDDLPKAAGFG